MGNQIVRSDAYGTDRGYDVILALVQPLEMDTRLRNAYYARTLASQIDTEVEGLNKVYLWMNRALRQQKLFYGKCSAWRDPDDCKRTFPACSYSSGLGCHVNNLLKPYLEHVAKLYSACYAILLKWNEGRSQHQMLKEGEGG